MISELLRIGPLAISPFGLFMMLAFLSAYWQLARGFRVLDVGDADTASSIVLGAGISGILGAKIYYAILYRDAGLLLDRAGFVWYGGFILATATVIVMVKRRGLDVWKVLDAATPALALGYAVGRVGCFLVGDDYGRPTDLPWGVKFPVGLPPTRAGYLESEFGIPIPAGVSPDELIAVHPTQLYETAIALAIAWIAWRGLTSRPTGSTALLVLGLLAAERFGIEMLRAKDDRFLGAFTVAQLISVVIVVVVVALAWRRGRHRAGTEATGKAP